MDIRNKLSFLCVIIFSVVLASCSSTETIDDAEDPAAVSVDGSGNSSTGDNNGAKAFGAGEGGSLSDADLASGNLEDLEAQGKLVLVYYFDFDRDTLTDETRQALDVVATVLKASKMQVKLNGHADERGTREYNLALSERRAKSVREYLAIQGVDRSQVEVIGYGEEKPAVAQSNEAGWSKNRRVELAR